MNFSDEIQFHFLCKVILLLFFRSIPEANKRSKTRMKQRDDDDVKKNNGISADKFQMEMND